MKHATRSRLLAGTATALLLVAAPAAADVYDLPDPDNDAFAVTTSGVSVGDFDIDLRNTRIDHGITNLVVTSNFSYTNADSWTDMWVEVDSNFDRVTDYTALWSKRTGLRGVVRNNPDGTTTTTCGSIGTSEVFGVNGSVSVNIPRTCLGSPPSVAIHTDVFWFGYNTSGEELNFVDSAPGLLTDTPTSFSVPVAATQAVTVPSPTVPVPAPAPVVVPTATPAVKTATTVSASLKPKTQKVGATPAKIHVLVKATGSSPTGKVKVMRGTKTLRTIKARANKTYRIAMPKNLTPGVHKIKVKFSPSDLSRYLGSTSKTLRLRVVR